MKGALRERGPILLEAVNTPRHLIGAPYSAGPEADPDIPPQSDKKMNEQKSQKGKKVKTES